MTVGIGTVLRSGTVRLDSPPLVGVEDAGLSRCRLRGGVHRIHVHAHNVQRRCRCDLLVQAYICGGGFRVMVAVVDVFGCHLLGLCLGLAQFGLGDACPGWQW